MSSTRPQLQRALNHLHDDDHIYVFVEFRPSALMLNNRVDDELFFVPYKDKSDFLKVLLVLAKNSDIWADTILRAIDLAISAGYDYPEFKIITKSIHHSWKNNEN